MAGHECYHCKQWIEEGEPHDCWSTTEAALTRHLSDDLREAWERLRETAAGFGEQRIYASHHSIMFSRKSCYFFVRPKQKYLELCVFLGRRLEAPQVRRVDQASKSKLYHLIRITHRDEVESPITDWAIRSVPVLERTLKAGCLEIDSRRDADSGTETQGHPAAGKGSAKGRTGFETRSVEATAPRSLDVLFLSSRLPCSLLFAVFFGRHGNPSGTQLCDPAYKFHRNGFVKWKVDSPLSLLIILEFFFERGEERTRCRKQGIVLLETREI